MNAQDKKKIMNLARDIAYQNGKAVLDYCKHGMDWVQADELPAWKRLEELLEEME